MGNFITPLPALPPANTVQGIQVNGQTYYPSPEGIISFTIDPGTAQQLEVQNYSASHSLVISNSDNHLRINSATPVTVSIPSAIDLPVRIGTRIYLEQAGPGTVNLVGAATLQIKASAYPRTAEQFAVVTLIKVAANTWLAYGELASKILPPPDPDPVGGVLTDSSGNTLTDSSGNSLVMGSSEGPGLPEALLTDSIGNALTDSVGNYLTHD